MTSPTEELSHPEAQRLLRDAPLLEYIAGARKVLAAEQVPAFEEAVGQIYERMVRITIIPSWARFFDFGVGRLPGFLKQLVREASS